MKEMEADDFCALVDPSGGVVSRRIFIEPDIYSQETERIFSRCWLYLCHESQIPRPGDFCTAYMGEEPVVVWRDMQGTIRAFLNMCRHRGNRLCRADAGNAKAMVCTYHGWTYACDGRLKAVPHFRTAYHGEMDLDRWALAGVAQLESYRGLVFATFDPEAPPLREYLGGMGWYLDAVFDRREGGVEVLAGVHKWTVPCNWKLAAENFCGDSYHGPWNHASAMHTGFSARRPRPVDVGRYHIAPGHGHCVMGRRPDDTSDGPDVLAYEQSVRPEVRARLGPRLDLVRPAVGTVFPNFSFNRGTAHSIRMWHPRGPDKTEIWSWIFVDKGCPDAVREAVRLASIRSFGPAGTFEQDDIDNWQECTQTARGPVARRYPVNIQMGLGHEHFDEGFNAMTSDFQISESNHREFYRQWARLMDRSTSWSDS